MRRLIIWIALALLALAGVAYAAFPRHADLLGFDPVVLARAETAMWRHYHEKQYLRLFYDLYEISRDQYGFSPWDSARIAVAAARAARAFQPSRSRSEADAALPYLIDYFRLLSPAASTALDVDAAARIELAWWQARREDVGPNEYGLLIARVTTLIYGVDDANIRRSGVLRANAMAYRDARRERVSDADWAAINDQLHAAYALLKETLPAHGGNRRL